MTETRDLLVEIGTEELPPKALRRLSESFHDAIRSGLAARGIAHGESAPYATPRRLAVLVKDVATSQPDREVERRGPGLNVAFDAEGRPTKAALGFARSCGVDVEHLEQRQAPEGSWLVFHSTVVGEATASLLPPLVEDALGKLPIPRRMRWSNLTVEFVRPVHWVVLLLGEDVVPGEVLGMSTGRMTRGHRFHHPDAIPLDSPDDYVTRLYGTGYVMAELDARAQHIADQIAEAAAGVGGRVDSDPELLDEVAALVEWPVPVVGSFDDAFLELPEAVLIATMRSHQRYFHLRGDDGALLPRFITIANIDSHEPEAVRSGNERVIRPRLADAAYFFRADLRTPLPDRRAALDRVVFQERLGTLGDKTKRVSRLAGHVAIAIGEPPDQVKLARRAGALAKCDLVTDMVGEFPELQGIMGEVYARRAGEPEQVAAAIGESYRPRFAGDDIPASSCGRAVAIADKVDTLVGIFGIGQAPSGDRDPFALRRAALGVLRIIIEGELNLDLSKLLEDAVDGFSAVFEVDGVAEQVLEFMMDRLRGYFVEQEVPVDVFAAVIARRPNRPLDFARRMHAVNGFRQLPEASSLATANKRIQNILKQAGDGIPDAVDDTLFSADAEWNLAAKLVGIGPRVRTLLKDGDYTAAMTSLAGLRDNVDEFFDKVKVMDDDAAVRNNRLALLQSISELFLETADISRLQE